MLVKFFSCVCAVGAGLPIGPEGPMIHLGYVARMLLILSNLSFDHIPKHLEEGWKHNAKRTIFNELISRWLSLQMKQEIRFSHTEAGQGQVRISPVMLGLVTQFSVLAIQAKASHTHPVLSGLETNFSAC